MRNLLFVLVFVSITILGCGWFKSPMENCADERLNRYQHDRELLYNEDVIDTTDDAYFERSYGLPIEEFLKKSYKKKMQNYSYEWQHRQCEKERVVAPKTFDAEYQ